MKRKVGVGRLGDGYGVFVLAIFGNSATDTLAGPMPYADARAIAAEINEALRSADRATKRFERARPAPELRAWKR